jgi:hypothetical protein
MSKEFNQLNQKYNDETYPVFPFIAKNRITLLSEGFYRKHRANFRGVTAVFNSETKEYEFPLYGMYYIPKNIVIVPEEMEMNDNKEAFLKAALSSGYEQVNSAPKFETFKFSPDSYEARLALANKVEHQYSDVEENDKG